MSDVPSNQRDDNEIDLSELINICWAAKWLIIVVTALFAMGSVIYALQITDIYRAEAVLASAESEQGTVGLSGQFGGAAALLGVNLAANGGDDISTSIATLKSRQFIGRFIEENNILVSLFAGTWEGRNEVNVIDDEKYDVETDTWLIDGGRPSSQAAYRVFSDMLIISGPDRSTGIITVSVDWINPFEAADWTNKLVAAINAEVRSKDVREASSAITFLRQQLEQTQLVEMQRVFYQLIESQTRIIMLADVREEYVFRVIDPAVVPDRKIAPRRSVTVILGTLIGLMFALVLVFVQQKLSPEIEKAN